MGNLRQFYCVYVSTFLWKIAKLDKRVNGDFPLPTLQGRAVSSNVISRENLPFILLLGSNSSVFLRQKGDNSTT